MSILFPITDEMRSVFKEYYKNDRESIEQILIILRERNFNQLQAVQLLIDELDIKLGEANSMVLHSRAWNT